MGFTVVLTIQQVTISLQHAMTPKVALTNIETTITQIIRLIKRFEK